MRIPAIAALTAGDSSANSTQNTPSVIEKPLDFVPSAMQASTSMIVSTANGIAVHTWISGLRDSSRIRTIPIAVIPDTTAQRIRGSALLRSTAQNTGSRKMNRYGSQRSAYGAI